RPDVADEAISDRVEAGGAEVPLRHPPDTGGDDDVHARAAGDAQDQVDVPSEIDGGQIDDGTDAAAVEVGHLPLGDVQDAVPVPEMGPVLLDSGGARDDVLVHQGGPELGRGDRAQRGLDGCHLDLLYRVQTSSTGLSPRTAASTTDSIDDSRSRSSAVSRPGPRSPRAPTV